MGKVLILKTLNSKIDNDRIFSYSNKNKITIATYDNILIHIGKKNNPISALINDIPIDTFSFVYFRTWLKKRNIALAVSLYLKNKGIPFADEEVIYQIGDKLSIYVLLAINALPVPETIYIPRAYVTKKINYLEQHLGYPFIMKSPGSDKGKDNYFISSRGNLKKAFSGRPQNIEFLFQKYIPNDFDYRLFVIDYKIKVIYEKYRKNNDTHLNNIAHGASYQYVTSDKKINIVNIAEQAAMLCRRNIAGVDIVVSKKNKRPFILEVNNAPGLATEKVRQSLGQFLFNKSKPHQ